MKSLLTGNSSRFEPFTDNHEANIYCLFTMSKLFTAELLQCDVNGATIEPATKRGPSFVPSLSHSKYLISVVFRRSRIFFFFLSFVSHRAERITTKLKYLFVKRNKPRRLFSWSWRAVFSKCRLLLERKQINYSHYDVKKLDSFSCNWIIKVTQTKLQKIKIQKTKIWEALLQKKL